MHLQYVLTQELFTSAKGETTEPAVVLFVSKHRGGVERGLRSNHKPLFRIEDVFPVTLRLDKLNTSPFSLPWGTSFLYAGIVRCAVRHGPPVPARRRCV